MNSLNIKNRLDIRLSRRRPYLACYFPVGDPLLPIEFLDSYAACGVDIVELGVASPDPFMDGADVAASMKRALAAGSPSAALHRTARYLGSRPDAPAAVAMTYADVDLVTPDSGDMLSDLDGLLMLGLDARPDAGTIRHQLRATDTREVVVVNSDLPADGVQAAIKSDTYIFLRTVAGKTGPRAEVDPANGVRVRQLRALGCTQPILLGFGISDAAQARAAVDLGADGVVIGSMCLRKALEGRGALEHLLTTVRSALDA